ncbi:MAG: RidA family protein [Phycisphaerales bacterium]|nr:MAG: RidA family protein [Planctomycetota bacterium]
MSTVRQRLADAGVTLPRAPKPIAAYVPSVRVGDLVFVSGQIPMLDGSLSAVGPVPSAVGVEAAAAAARLCGINAMAVLADALDGDLDRVRRIVRIGVFVASDPGFVDQPRVANGASDLLVEVFGEAGRHTRAAVGSVGLPMGATVEVELLAEVR